MGSGNELPLHALGSVATLARVVPHVACLLDCWDPLYYQLKELFAPDDDEGDDDIIVVIDSDDDNNLLIDDLVVQALPAAAYYPLTADIIVISSNDNEDFIDDLFDLDVDLGFSSEEENGPAVVADDAVSGLSNIDPTHLNPAPIEEEIMSPVISVPIISASEAAIQESLHSIPHFILRDESSSSYETD